MDERVMQSFLRISGNIAGMVREFSVMIADTKIEPQLRVKMLATSTTALTELRDLYQELIDAQEIGSNN